MCIYVHTYIVYIYIYCHNDNYHYKIQFTNTITIKLHAVWDSNYCGRALIDGRMVSCTFISVLTQMYEWWYGKSSTLAIRNACATSHVHVYILACHILTSKKTTSVETLSGVFTSVHDFYFHPPLICKKSRQLLENLAWILSQKCMVSPCPLKHF